MRFILRCFVIGDAREVSISREQFNLAAAAHKRMQLFVASEEKFDAIARNYLDFESDMLNSALEQAFVGLGQGMEQMGVRRLLNRKLSNLLSATRSYKDFIDHSAKNVLPSKAEAESVTALFSEYYDNLLSYRALEEVRNHAQHAGFPIKCIKYSTTVMRDIPGIPLKKIIAPILNLEELEQNKRLKSRVVSEITKSDEKVSLKRFVREYVASMAKIHERFRELASPIFSKDAAIIQELVQAFSTENAINEPLALYAESLEGTKCIQQIHLGDGLYKYGEFLAAGNAHFTQASISFVSGELENDS